LGAALGSKLCCAVFGKFGLRAAAGFYEGRDTTSRMAEDARRLAAAAMFHVQWDDELFPRDGQLALFDALGSSEKVLIAFPGRHGETNPAAPPIWRDFVVAHLRPESSDVPA
jgi:hypothetical protein